MGSGTFPGAAHALDVDLEETSQFTHEEVHVDPRTAVHVRGVLAGQHSHLHDFSG